MLLAYERFAGGPNKEPGTAKLEGLFLGFAVARCR